MLSFLVCSVSVRLNSVLFRTLVLLVALFVRKLALVALVSKDYALYELVTDYVTVGKFVYLYVLNAVEYANSRCITVFGRNNNTFGPAFYYSLKAAEEGCIAFVTSNSPAQMAPFGGSEKMLGTNPFSAVIPVPDGDPIIIDFATSVVAKSKFKEYQKKGLKLPDGWALDESGNPTNDPEEGMKGFILPMAGFKGYGIAMLIDIVAGLLSGSAYLNQVGRFYSNDTKSMNVGFCISVMDPQQIFGEDYSNAIQQYVADLKQSRKAEGKDIVLPGDDRITHKNVLVESQKDDRE